MPVLSYFRKDLTISFRKLLAIVLLFSFSFAWFFAFYNYFEDIFTGFTNDFWSSAGANIFLISTVISATIGSAIADRVNRRKFLFLWITFGALILVPIPFIRGNELSLAFGILAGASFGLGFPSCMAFLADSTETPERGRISGIAILTSFVLTVLGTVIASALGFAGEGPNTPSTPFGLILISIGIKLTSLLAFIVDPIDREETKAESWRSLFSHRDFILYTLAYVSFNIAAGLVHFIWLGLPQTPEYESVRVSATLLRYLGLGVFAIIAGLMADRVGRKKPIMIGIVLLAASYLLIGILTSLETYFVNLLFSGFAWGIIMVVYLVMPGDLSPRGSTERFYAIGWLIPLVCNIGVSGITLLPDFDFPLSVFSYILSIALFSSMIPIFMAKETLSEGTIRKRELEEHIERVGRELQKSE